MTLQCEILLCQQTLPMIDFCAEIIIYNVDNIILPSTNDKSISEDPQEATLLIPLLHI